jgi:mannosyl-3-phosphoglycerate phosphatase
LRKSTSVVYCAVDDLAPATGSPVAGFPDFLEGLSEAGVPCIWITSRSRTHLDSTLRKLGQSAPFIAEGGSGVYIPEDYFHLKPSRTTRLGRFTCIPVASPQPAASDALESLAEEAGITVVPLSALSPRELVQNTGLPQREAETMRLRDFDEYFFFAGASNDDINRFRKEAAHKQFSVRPRGALWSLAIGADLRSCIRELTKLFDRAFRGSAFNIAIATSADAPELFPTCNKSILLSGHPTIPDPPASQGALASLTFPLSSPNAWQSALDAILSREL